MSPRNFFFGLLVLAVMACALGVVYQRHHHRQLFIALSSFENQRDELNVEYGRLQLELATMTATDRVEQLAVSHLGMRLAQPEEQRVVVLQ
ncbi:MAG: cell division protein FtsL [Xanthomonadaceae bacterium]|nr:cell division protein FtsL [Xanthomonadaceae bacterium]MDP2186128.1 cell division protein FtsL [Xanthomonadales bacterium]MDZ4116180.1 cell division protein FtsL [Xanthomonadaceae bacterium]MDZ4377638.1 cell division protein FtsL [Xanthomonadaceae bacterium]